MYGREEQPNKMVKVFLCWFVIFVASDIKGKKTTEEIYQNVSTNARTQVLEGDFH